MDGMKKVKLIKNYDAQSEVVGYVLTVLACVTILSSTAFVMNLTIDNQKKNVANIEAQSLANRVAAVITETATVKQNLTNADISQKTGSYEIQGYKFEKKIVIPNKIGGYKYSIKVTDSEVTVETNAGEVEKSCSLYNLVKRKDIKSISGEVHSDYTYLKVSIEADLAGSNPKSAVDVNVEGEL